MRVIRVKDAKIAVNKAVLIITDSLAKKHITGSIEIPSAEKEEK